ncbi:MAG TPA: cytochrome P450, partial [Acidimicrobiales bacterium]|nr:cytochrome P450 [Acidimicrobiales bacterium]
MTTAELDPFDLEVLADPYDLYARMRETTPVHYVPSMDLFLVSRYADVRDAASRKEEFSSHLTAVIMATAENHEAVGAELVQLDAGVDAVDVLATADPPDHTKQRKTVARTFRQIEQAEPAIRSVIDSMLAPMVDAGRCDLMGDFALWVPVRVIAEVLGLPDEDAELIKRGADCGVELLSGVTPPDRLAECITGIIEFSAYVEDHVANGLTRAPERLFGLLAGFVDDGTITAPEATAIALQVVIAGSDSTGNLIGNAVRLLAENPEVQAEVRADLRLIPAYLEEVLRLESPFRGHFRVATRATTLGGTDIHEGARLFLMWGSANRDPEVFEHPDELVLHRSNAGDHLGFGWGVHRCVGAPLARLEARLALERLLAATSHIEPRAGAPAPAYVPSMLIRSLAHLHLEVH